VNPAQPLYDHIRDIPDFPQPGVVFRDITPLLGDAASFRLATDLMVAPFEMRAPSDEPITKVVGIEARGFILAAPIAHELGAGFVPVRKPGKLPWESIHEEYALEYGTDRLEVHSDAVIEGARVLVVDDVIATGGTAAATCRLVEALGATVIGIAAIIELAFLDGRARLEGREISSLLVYG
jgi:adenine phosphoribosyltransferase